MTTEEPWHLERNKIVARVAIPVGVFMIGAAVFSMEFMCNLPRCVRSDTGLLYLGAAITIAGFGFALVYLLGSKSGGDRA